jgi:hypothetical protein
MDKDLRRELAERFCSSEIQPKQDPNQVKKLGDELGRFVIGE